MIKQLFNTSEFVKNSSILIGGTLFAQIVPVALQPVLRRVFTPEEFGLTAVYFSIVSILGVAASWQYHAAIILPKSDRDSNSIVMGCLAISVITSLIVLVILVLFGDSIISFFEFPRDLKQWLFLIPISVFFTSGHLIFGNWLNRRKAYKELAINKISRRSAEGISQFTFGKLWSGNGLILGSFIGDIINFFTYVFQFLKTKGSFVLNTNTIKQMLGKYSDFPKYSLLPNLSSTISLFLPVIIINGLYSEEITGQFDLSRQILALPLALISVSVGQVLLQRLSKSVQDQKSIRNDFMRVLKFLTLLSIIGASVLFLWGKELFGFIFGGEWEMAGAITEVLVLGYAIKFIVSPLIVSFIALEKIKLNSAWQLAYLALILILYNLPEMSLTDFLVIYVIIDVIAYICYGLLAYSQVRKYERNIKNESDT